MFALLTELDAMIQVPNFVPFRQNPGLKTLAWPVVFLKHINCSASFFSSPAHFEHFSVNRYLSPAHVSCLLRLLPTTVLGSGSGDRQPTTGIRRPTLSRSSSCEPNNYQRTSKCFLTKDLTKYTRARNGAGAWRHLCVEKDWILHLFHER